MKTITEKNYNDFMKLIKKIEKLNYKKVLELPKSEQNDNNFNILDWEFECGQPACVAGHAKFMFPDREIKFDDPFTALSSFGLDEEDSNRICEPDGYAVVHPKPITVAKRMRKILSTYLIVGDKEKIND